MKYAVGFSETLSDFSPSFFRQKRDDPRSCSAIIHNLHADNACNWQSNRIHSSLTGFCLSLHSFQSTKESMMQQSKRVVKITNAFFLDPKHHCDFMNGTNDPMMTVVLKTFPRSKADHKCTKTRKLQRRANCCSHLYLPTQFPICPSPVHPRLHAHVKVPISSVHEPAGDGSQVSSAVPHSTMSVKTNLPKCCYCVSGMKI